ncbi:hypothetical protein M2B96_04760 [Klebsiella pneumoniae]|nr:hypothetical protein [Klebsiella pneumoniae]
MQPWQVVLYCMYLAEVVKTMTTDPVTGEVNKAANVAVHAGAATGEVVGISVYGNTIYSVS